MRAAEPESIFCFSVEKGVGDSFNLQKTGRFAHSFSYIEHISSTTGWKIQRNVNVRLRKEKGEWVNGVLFLLQHTA